jgi:hypothetical protein
MYASSASRLRHCRCAEVRADGQSRRLALEGAVRSLVDAAGGESGDRSTLRLVVSLEGRTDVPELF